MQQEFFLCQLVPFCLSAIISRSSSLILTLSNNGLRNAVIFTACRAVYNLSVVFGNQKFITEIFKSESGKNSQIYLF
jgi:hypothetical protein